MNCYDCAGEGTSTPSIGICVRCGAACCGRHGSMTTMRGAVPTGNLMQQTEVTARSLVCSACAV